MSKIYILYTLEDDGACGDPECCGSPSIEGIDIFKITRNIEEAKELIKLSEDTSLCTWHDSLIERKNKALLTLKSKYGLDEIPSDLMMNEGDLKDV